jgi:hypothetical protein
MFRQRLQAPEGIPVTILKARIQVDQFVSGSIRIILRFCLHPLERFLGLREIHGR